MSLSALLIKNKPLPAGFGQMKTSNNTADQPKRTLLTGFGSFDYMAQDYTSKYRDYHDALYCNQHLGKGVLPRCPFWEKVFNRGMFNNKALNYTANSFDDIFYPPKFIKPSNRNNPREIIITTIDQLIKVLGWWVNEKIEPYSPAFWFYNYSPRPCGQWILKSGIDFGVGSLIKKFKFSQPTIAARLEKHVSNLAVKATEWDGHARLKRQTQCWVDLSPQKMLFVNPIEAKRAAAAMLYELKDIDQYLKSLKNKGSGNKMSKKSRALAVLIDNPDWPNKDIANAAGVHPKSLPRMKDFREARKILKSGKSNIPKGRKDAETGGIEAWQE